MAPKKKSMPHNAFYFYMRSFKAENKCTHSMTNNELAEAAGPYWERLPNSERVKYEKMALDWKRGEQKALEHKYTTTGVSYAELERQEQEQKDKEKNMNMEIENTISELDHDTTLITKEFYLIHVNFYCHTDIGTYIPCEVAVLEFTMKNGVQCYYETIINVDDVPLGYSFEALKVSEETHQIPVPPHSHGERGYYNIFCKIRQLLQGQHQMRRVLPPLYTHSNVIPVVESFFKILIENTGAPDDLFRVYPLSKLFFELRNACAQNAVFPVISVAERELDKDHFSFTQGISCEFHETTDAKQFCSLSYVKRWTYTVCDHCCQDVNINLVPGYHVPLFADTQHYLKFKQAVKDQPSCATTPSKEIRKPFSALLKSEDSACGRYPLQSVKEQPSCDNSTWKEVVRKPKSALYKSEAVKEQPSCDNLTRKEVVRKPKSALYKSETIKEQPTCAASTWKDVRRPKSALLKAEESSCGSNPSLAVKEQPSCASSTWKNVRRPNSALLKAEESSCGSYPSITVKEQPSRATSTWKDVRKPMSGLFKSEESACGYPSLAVNEQPSYAASISKEVCKPFSALFNSEDITCGYPSLTKKDRASKSSRPSRPLYVAPSLRESQNEYSLNPLQHPANLSKSEKEKMPDYIPITSSKQKEYGQMPVHTPVNPSNQNKMKTMSLHKPMSSSTREENETNADYVSTRSSNDAEDDLKPLRRPRTRSIAMTKAFADPTFCENAMRIFDELYEPVAVAGRGKRLNRC